MVRNTDPVALNTALLSSTHFAFQQECGGSFGAAWSGRGWYDNVIAVDPKDPDRVWAGGVDLFRSDDAGRTWGLANYWWEGNGFAHADQHALVFHPQYDGTRNQTLMVAGDGGVYRTDNARALVARGDAAPCDSSGSAVRWTSLDHGYSVTQFYRGAVFAGGLAYLGGAQDLGTIVGGDAGGPEGWRQVLGRDGGFVAVYAESDHLSFVKSTDGGNTFTSAAEGIGGASFPYIAPFALDPLDGQRLWLGGDSLWTTDDGAEHWHRASSALGANALDLLSAVAVSPHDDQHVLAGTSQGLIVRNDAALSAVPGTPWLAAHPRDGFVSSLVFDPQDLGVVEPRRWYDLAEPRRHRLLPAARPSRPLPRRRSAPSPAALRRHRSRRLRFARRRGDLGRRGHRLRERSHRVARPQSSLPFRLHSRPRRVADRTAGLTLAVIASLAWAAMISSSRRTTPNA